MSSLALSGVLLVVNLVHFVRFCGFVLRYPYDFDYGEGIVWQQMRNIVAGQGYVPLGVFPGIVYHYPPVYHLTVAGVAALGGLDQLFAGRLVSLLAAVAAMALTGVLAMACVGRDEDRRVRLAAGAVAGLCLASTREVVAWAPTMRVDLLAVALGLAGLVFAIRAAARPANALVAGLLFTMAIYTKQTSIAAPVAACIGLCVVNRRAALMLVATCVALGLPALVVLERITDGGFLHHIVTYNINRFDPGGAHILLVSESRRAVLIALAAIGAVACWRRLRAAPATADIAAPLVMLAFLALKALMLPAMLKSGASTNYLIEWVCALCVFVGVALVPALRIAGGGMARLAPVAALAITIGLPFQLAMIPDLTPTPAAVARKVRVMDGIVAMIRAARRPVISDDMVLTIRAGRPVLWEPAITAELGHDGRYDEHAFARLVRSGTFGFFFTQGRRGESPFDQRYNPVVADAIMAAYPVTREVDGEYLHLPRR